MKNILITGGSGFIGTKLSEELLLKGYKVIIFDFLPPKIQNSNLSFEQIDLSKEKIPQKYDGMVDAIVHLAGKNIFGKWTLEFKKAVYESRIQSTKNIVDSIASWQKKPSVLVSASAFGFYGDKKEDLVNENSSAGDDFLAKVCMDWEAEAKKAENFGVRSVQIRTAHVLGKGGLLAPLFVPFRFNLGAWIGEGRAWMPWVHIDDIVNIYIFSLENEKVAGAINTGANEQVRQKELMKTFGKVLGKKVLFSIPIFVLRLQYGDLALTFDNSVKMSSAKLIDLGCKFKFLKLFEALADVAKK